MASIESACSKADAFATFIEPWAGARPERASSSDEGISTYLDSLVFAHDIDFRGAFKALGPSVNIGRGALIRKQLDDLTIIEDVLSGNLNPGQMTRIDEVRTSLKQLETSPFSLPGLTTTSGFADAVQIGRQWAAEDRRITGGVTELVGKWITESLYQERFERAQLIRDWLRIAAPEILAGLVDAFSAPASAAPGTRRRPPATGRGSRRPSSDSVGDQDAGVVGLFLEYQMKEELLGFTFTPSAMQNLAKTDPGGAIVGRTAALLAFELEIACVSIGDGAVDGERFGDAEVDGSAPPRDPLGAETFHATQHVREEIDAATERRQRSAVLKAWSMMTPDEQAEFIVNHPDVALAYGLSVDIAPVVEAIEESLQVVLGRFGLGGSSEGAEEVADLLDDAIGREAMREREVRGSRANADYDVDGDGLISGWERDEADNLEWLDYLDRRIARNAEIEKELGG